MSKRSIDIQLDTRRLCQGSGGYSAAGIYPHIDNIIFLFDTPRNCHLIIESFMEEIVSHETIHLVIKKIQDNYVSGKFDYFFGLLGSLSKFLEEGH